MKAETRAGLGYGLAAYGFWGVIAVYFKFVRSVPPLEILAHRILWSVVFLLLTIALLHRWRELRTVLRSRKALAALAFSACLIASNWYIFIWAVTRNHMVEASLGYFINPLVNVLLGFAVLGERLRRWEAVSVALAAAGVVWLTVVSGVVPWISLILALSFGVYGLTRKLAGVGSIEGLTVETALLVPIALAFMVLRARSGELVFANETRSMDLLLIAAGPITALPLLWFAAAVSRLRFATIGVLQYISPSIQFALATLVFGEPMNRTRLVAFAFIWSAIVLYTAENFRHHTAARPMPPE